MRGHLIKIPSPSTAGTAKFINVFKKDSFIQSANIHSSSSANFDINRAQVQTHIDANRAFVSIHIS